MILVIGCYAEREGAKGMRQVIYCPLLGVGVQAVVIIR